MYKEEFKKRLDNLLRFDKVRIHKLIKIAEYSILYVLIGGILGTIIEYLFPDYDPNKSNTEILKEIILQTILIGICIFYLRKIVKCFPYIGLIDSDYSETNNTFSFCNGDVIISIVLIGTQTNFIKKIRHESFELKKFFSKTSNKFNKVSESFVDSNQNEEEQEEEEKELNNKKKNIMTQSKDENNLSSKSQIIEKNEDTKKIKSANLSPTKIQNKNENTQMIQNKKNLVQESFIGHNYINNQPNQFLQQTNISDLSRQNQDSNINDYYNDKIINLNNFSNDFSSSNSNIMNNSMTNFEKNNITNNDNNPFFNDHNAFKAQSLPGNYSFINNNNNENVNISQTLDYSEILKNTYN